MTTVNLSPELSQRLQELAQVENTTVEAVLEDVLNSYLDGYELNAATDEEVQAVREAFDEAHQPNAVIYTFDEVTTELLADIEAYKTKNQLSESVLVETVLEGYLEEDESDENVVELMQALQEALDEDPQLTLTYHNSADLLNAILNEPEPDQVF